MIEEILKRDGSKQKFEPYKIEDVIKNAFESENVVYSPAVFLNVIELIKKNKVIAVEDIQDIIEKELYETRYFKVMKSFISVNIVAKI